MEISVAICYTIEDQNEFGMLNLEFATHYAAFVVTALLSMLLILRRNDGETSRLYLGLFYVAMSLIFAYQSYLYYYDLYPKSIVTIPYLIVGVVYSCFYLSYPVEVISPGYMTNRKFIYLFTPVLLCIVIYFTASRMGVNFEQYSSLVDFISSPITYTTIFIYVLLILMITPQLLLYFIPYTRRYNNTDKAWIKRFIIISSIATCGFILKLFNIDPFAFLNVLIFIVVSVYIIYFELFSRIILKRSCIEDEIYTKDREVSINHSIRVETSKSYDEVITDHLIQFLEKEQSWRDPDFSLQDLINKIGLSRKAVSLAIQEMGYDNFPHFMNTLRVKDFITILEHGKFDSFQNIFFDVGFRSRATAYRNFKQITGVSPSEYFARIKDGVE